MNKTDELFKKRIKIIEYYLKNGEALRQTSRFFKIPYQTVHRWVRWYKENGIDGLKRKRIYKRAWNRTSDEIEHKVMFLKEKDPSLTIKKAREILKKDGIEISVKGIWNIWKRYALTGRSRENPYQFFGEKTAESMKIVSEVKEYVKNGDYEKAGLLLSNLPSCPKVMILKKIPDEYLSDRRKFDKLSILFREIPFPEYYEKLKNLRKKFEKKGLNYSALKTLFLEILTLHWMGNIRELEKLLPLLKKKMSGIKEPALKFIFYFHIGATASFLCDEEKAYKMLSKCKELLPLLPYPFYERAIASFHSHLRECGENINILKRLLKVEKGEMRGIILQKLAVSLSGKGRVDEAKKCIRKAEKNLVGSGSALSLARANCAFFRGNLEECLHYLAETLDLSDRLQYLHYINVASLKMASVYKALNKEEQAIELLNQNYELMEKFGLRKYMLYCALLMNKNIPFTNKEKKIPHLYIVFLLREAQRTGKLSFYKKAIKFAKQKGHEDVIYFNIFFFPLPVIKLLEKGEDTGLPHFILKLPIFNKKIPVYTLKFLGPLVIYKNHKRIKAKLYPKDAAFLIHFVLRAGEPGKEIPVKSLYNNFWYNSLKPSRSLSAVLFRLKKLLKIPGHLIKISWRGRVRVLINKGIYFTTDYSEFKQRISRANLKRADDWKSSKKEFLKAFSLIRGEPFKKMYDRWSEDVRLGIIFEMEKKFIEFIKECLNHHEVYLARQIQKKALQIIKYSEELKNII